MTDIRRFEGTCEEAKDEAVSHLIKAKVNLEWGGMDALKLVTARNEINLALARLEQALEGDLT